VILGATKESPCEEGIEDGCIVHMKAEKSRLEG